MIARNLNISAEARAHVAATIESWTGDNRDLALALLASGHAMLLIIDGRSDHIGLYEDAAQAVLEASKGSKLHG